MGASADARVALFRALIDHAPLFPPASLDLPDALAEDQRARESPAAFALGRLVWPASRLRELPETGRALSVVLDGEVDTRDEIEAVETRFGGDLGAVAGVANEIYVEVPIDGELEPRLDALVAAGLRAKVRCGGSHVPTVRELARFLAGCRVRALPFKATAGLHHAVRTNGEHGFLNLLAAAVFADEEAALDSESDALSVDEEAFRWGNRAAGAAEIERARHGGLRSIGSCSFFEPIEELAALGALP